MGWQETLIELLNLPRGRDAKLPATALPMAMAGAPLAQMAEFGANTVAAAPQSAWSGFTLPMDAWEGKVDQNQMVDRSLDFAGLMGGGGVAVGKPAGSLGTMAGTRAVHAPQVDLQVGEALAKKGFKPEEIWGQTGIEVGPDKVPRWEISDQKMAWSPKATDWRLSKTQAPTVMTLEEWVTHPELFANYPELGKIPLEALPRAQDKMLAGGAGGYYHPGAKRIVMPTEDMQSFPESSLGVVAHEGQHGVQHIEEWAGKGANPQWMLNEGVNRMRLEIDELGRRLGPWHPEVTRRFNILNRVYSDPKVSSSLAYNLYNRELGEAQARATQHSLRWDDAMRRSMIPLARQMEADPSQLFTIAPWGRP